MAGQNATKEQRRRRKREKRQRNRAREIERLRSAVVAERSPPPPAGHPDLQAPVQCYGYWIPPAQLLDFLAGLRGSKIDFLAAPCHESRRGYHVLTGAAICQDPACREDHKALAGANLTCIVEGLRAGRLELREFRVSGGWASLPEWLAERAGVARRGGRG